MSNQYEVIDQKSWDRAIHCMVFRNSIEPAFCVTFEDNLEEYCEKALKIATEQKEYFTGPLGNDATYFCSGTSFFRRRFVYRPVC